MGQLNHNKGNLHIFELNLSLLDYSRYIRLSALGLLLFVLSGHKSFFALICQSIHNSRINELFYQFTHSYIVSQEYLTLKGWIKDVNALALNKRHKPHDINGFSPLL